MALSTRIQTIPPEQQRYETVGDWYYRNPASLQIRFSDLGNEDYEFLIAVHEFIEAYLCRKHDIREADVDTFDMTWTGSGEPGAAPMAPYHKEHCFAEQVEVHLAAELGINWDAYGKAIDDILGKEL